MRMSPRAVSAVAVVLLSAGVLLGLALTALATWGDLEGSLFDTDIGADASLGTLRCPILVTADETGVIRASFRNRSDRRMQPYIRAHITQGYISLMREIRTDLPLEPGERRSLEWTVTAEDAVFGRLILARVQAFRTYPQPTRRGSCGILVADVGGWSGKGITASVVVASLLSMGVGLGILIQRNRPLKGRKRNLIGASGFLMAMVAAGLLVSLLQWWVLGLILLVVTVLLIGAIIRDLVVSD